MPTSGNFQVNEGDWEELNFILRQFQDRMDELGGDRGSYQHESNIDLNSNRVVNVADPVDDSDVVTKKYVEDRFAQTDVVADEFEELKEVGLPIANVGAGFPETALNISNEPSSGKMLVANKGVQGGYTWKSAHQIHTLVSGVF